MSAERIRAALRMLLDSGDITPMGVRAIEATGGTLVMLE